MDPRITALLDTIRPVLATYRVASEPIEEANNDGREPSYQDYERRDDAAVEVADYAEELVELLIQVQEAEKGGGAVR